MTDLVTLKTRDWMQEGYLVFEKTSDCPQIPIPETENQSIGKGSISSLLGWGCLGFRDSEDWNVAIFSDSRHGRCELFRKVLEVVECPKL